MNTILIELSIDKRFGELLVEVVAFAPVVEIVADADELADAVLFKRFLHDPSFASIPVPPFAFQHAEQLGANSRNPGHQQLAFVPQGCDDKMSSPHAVTF